MQDRERPKTNGSRISEAPGRGLSRRGWLLMSGTGVAMAGLGVYGLAAAAESKVAGVPSPDRRAKVKGAPKLVIAHGPSPTRNLAALLGSIGGMGKLVRKGDVVVVKPNIGWDRTPAQAANTDPDLVAAVVSACIAAGAKEVIVTDNPVNEARRSFERSGIRAAAEKAGARVILPDQAEKRKIDLPGKGTWVALDPLLRANKLINLPVAKHHGLTQFTGGLKNWFGSVLGNRHDLHPKIEESIVGLALLMRPTVTIMDATRVLLRNGPTGGNLADVKRMDTVALSFDPVAVDAWAASELGFDPAKLAHLRLAERKGLGQLDWRSLRPVEVNG